MDIFLGVLFIIICLLLVIVVLLQKGRGGGLGSAFGGAAASAFGTRVGDVFTWVTIVLVALFLLLAIGTTMLFRPEPGLVARPYFTPKPEEYTNYDEPTFVKMNSATPDTEIWYTLDGSEPTEDGPSSVLFKSMAQVTSGTTVKARAYREGGWTPSTVSEAFYGPPPELPADETAPTLPSVQTEPAGEEAPAGGQPPATMPTE